MGRDDAVMVVGEEESIVWRGRGKAEKSPSQAGGTSFSWQPSSSLDASTQRLHLSSLAQGPTNQVASLTKLQSQLIIKVGVSTLWSCGSPLFGLECDELTHTPRPIGESVRIISSSAIRCVFATINLRSYVTVDLRKFTLVALLFTSRR